MQVKIGDITACANVHELLFMKDEHFPILFEGKQIDRQHVIEKLSFNLANLYGDETLFRQEWDRITSRADTEKQKDQLKTYFDEVSHHLKELIPDFDK